MTEPSQTVVCLTMSDFQLGTFDALLENLPEPPPVRVARTPFGQVEQLLVGADHPCWSAGATVAVVWTRPQAVVPAYRRALACEPVASAELRDDVDRFADRLLALRRRVDVVLVPTWTRPPAMRGLGLLDLRAETGHARRLLEMNARLCERLDEDGGCFALDAQRWVAAVGPGCYSPRHWYVAKAAFHPDLMRHAALEVKAALLALHGGARKLVVVDLDDTIWGGVVGDVGWENLVLGGHDPAGEAFADFQRELRALRNRGVLLGIVSKNEEQVALEAIRRHPEMVLRLDDFVGWRIDWRDKAQNLVELAEELGLGLQSVVFLDDNPVERERVARALPEVLVPDWPPDKTSYPSALAALSCFDPAAIEQEDRRRTQLYAAERKRRELRPLAQSFDAWLSSLEQRVEIAPLDGASLPRAAQLLDKTNQMNLTTRRMSQSELERWASQDGRWVWVFRVSDRFGDSGLTGLLGLERGEGELVVVDFVLSCRVLGRRVEETLAAFAVERARALGGVERVVARYLATPKNVPCLRFWERSGFASDGRGTFVWSAAYAYPYPSQIEIVRRPAREPAPSSQEDPRPAAATPLVAARGR